MAILSKLIAKDAKMHLHFLEDDCWKNIIKLSRTTFINMILIYSILNGLSLILRKRKITSLSTWITFLSNTMGPTLHFTLINIGFQVMYCFFISKVGLLHPYFSPVVVFVVSFLAGQVHNVCSKKKHTEFMSVLALTSTYPWLCSLGLMPLQPYDKILLYCTAFAVLSYHYICGHEHKLTKQMRYIFGFEAPDSHQNFSREVPQIHPSYTQGFIELNFPRVFHFYKTVAERLMKFGPKHQRCTHQNSCIPNSISGFMKSFAIGSVLSVILRIPDTLTLFNHQTIPLKQLLSDSKMMRMGLYFGCTSALFKSVRCFLNYVRTKKDNNNELIAGFLAGFPIVFYPSQFIIFYTVISMIQCLYKEKSTEGYFPEVNELTVDFLISFLFAYLMYLTAFQPQICSNSLKKCANRLSPGCEDFYKKMVPIAFSYFQ